MNDSRVMPPACWLALAATLCVIKVAWLLVDHTPMVFLGDSWTYLVTATSAYIPTERSYFYGRFVELVAVRSGSLHLLLAVQATCSILAAMLMAWILDREFRAGVVATLAVPIAWAAIEPIGILYERYIMAEATALPLFAAFVAASLAYLRTRRLAWLGAAHAFGLGVITLRFAFVPISWVAVVALPLLAHVPQALPGVSRRDAVVRAAGHLAVSIAVAASLHAVYKYHYGKLLNLPPAYQYGEGFFMTAALAPLITRSDFPDGRMADEVLGSVKCELRDRHVRDHQRWWDGCLVSRIQQAAGPGRDANQLAKSIATSAMLRDPLGLASLTLRSWADWFDREKLQAALRYDRGERGLLPEYLQLIRERFRMEASSWPFLKTPTNQWFLASGLWVMFLVASPFYFWVVLAASPGWARARAAWLVLLLLAIVGLCVVASVAPAPRYMHPVAWLVTLGLAVAWDAVRARRKLKAGTGSDTPAPAGSR